jgi:hypothetical protein
MAAGKSWLYRNSDAAQHCHLDPESSQTKNKERKFRPIHVSLFPYKNRTQDCRKTVVETGKHARFYIQINT